MPKPKIAFENMHDNLVLYAVNAEVEDEVIKKLWTTVPGILFSRIVSNIEISRGEDIPGQMPGIVTVYLRLESGSDSNTIAFVNLMTPSLAKEYAALLGGELCTYAELMEALADPSQDEGVLVC